VHSIDADQQDMLATEAGALLIAISIALVVVVSRIGLCYPKQSERKGYKYWSVSFEHC
jgi:hypothetical protein